ncbi:hypothetical protein PIB30_071236 [Stylosanthes scabra]|uniref:Uncharacterized protein n=1 Tax=Stylosanthes scabra TaxID=79078 RepID=A0ABU6SQ77_9FABA|nr:hypothetical protein [Stylosanthes scabra]
MEQRGDEEDVVRRGATNEVFAKDAASLNAEDSQRVVVFERKEWRLAPLFCNPLRFKRFRSTPDFNLTESSNVNPTTPTTAHLSDIDNGFRFPVHLNSPSSFSHFFQSPSLLDPERNNVNMVFSTTTSSPSNFQCKMELPSNQIEPLEVKLDVEYTEINSLNTNNGLVGDILLSETQNFASGN